jgi:serine/threonine protein kinase
MGPQIKKEIAIMKMVKHENIVKLYEVLASRSKIFIVLELVTGGELFDKIVAEGRLDESNARTYFRQLLKGLKYCHSQGVCHRDLKPENLLLDANGLLKISDFGLSNMFVSGESEDGRATLLHTTCGTPNYVAPEVLADKGYDGRPADTWSAGVILYVLLAGFLPFDEQHMSKLFAKIQKAEFVYPAWFTAPVKKLISSILVPDPTTRATISMIEADPWFIGPDNYHDDNNPFSHGPAVLTYAEKKEAESASSSSSTETVTEKKKLVHIPSSKDMDDAVADLDDEHDEQPSGSATKVAPILNAFDVVTMLGGLELGRMVDVAASGGAADGKKIVHTTPQFLSSAPVSKIMSRLSEELAKLGVTSTVDEGGFSLKGRIVTGRGEISLVCDVYRMGDGAIHLVEIRRGRGDILEFRSIANKLTSETKDLAIPGK